MFPIFIRILSHIFVEQKPGFRHVPGVRPSEAAHPSAASTRNRGRARGSDRVAIEVAIESRNSP